MPDFWNSWEIGHGSLKTEIRMLALSHTTPDLNDMDSACSQTGFLTFSWIKSINKALGPLCHVRKLMGRYYIFGLLILSHHCDSSFAWDRKASKVILRAISLHAIIILGIKEVPHCTTFPTWFLCIYGIVIISYTLIIELFSLTLDDSHFIVIDSIHFWFLRKPLHKFLCLMFLFMYLYTVLE